MISFLNFLLNVYLVFLVKLVIISKNTSFNRRQIGNTLGFVYIKYKIQGALFKFTVFDLQQNPKRSIENHKQFYLIYVQLFRLQSLKDVSFLKLI